MAVEIEGLDDILDTLDGVVDNSAMQQAMGRACALVEASAKTNARKVTGQLRNSIKSKVEAGGGEIVGVIYTPLEYAPYVEYGTGLFAENDGGRKDVPWVYIDDEGKGHTTSGQKPRPFMQPALDENRDKIIEILGEGLLND